MVYELKHFDDVLMTFSLEREPLKGVVCKVKNVNEDKKEYLPIGMVPDDDGVLSWLKSRTVPKNRGYVEALLASMSLAENDVIGVLNVCKGLSLNDSYWVVEEGFDGAFTKYNLYDNKFLTALSLIAYTGYGSVRAKGFTSSPEFTTNGMLRKGWRRLDDKIYL